MVVSSDIQSLIQDFRKSKYFEDVVGQNYACFVVSSTFKEKLIYLDGAEFKEEFTSLLNNYTMIRPEIFKSVFSANKTEKIKKLVAQISTDAKSPKEILNPLVELEQSSLHFGSYLLSIFTEGEFIVFHEEVFKGLKEIFPRICERWLGIEMAREVDDYFMFNNVCKNIMYIYGFKTMSEVHEFLFHGQDTDWDFNK